MKRDKFKISDFRFLKDTYNSKGLIRRGEGVILKAGKFSPEKNLSITSPKEKNFFQGRSVVIRRS